MSFDINAARGEGYSDTEIAEYLSRNRNFDLQGAREEGYSDAEIAEYLTAREAVSLGTPFSDPGPRAAPPRVSAPRPQPGAPPAQKPFDPYGGYYSPDRGMPPKDPNDPRWTVAESLRESLGESFEAPSFEDWSGSLRGTLARTIQGYRLDQLEALEDEILGRSWPVGRDGDPKYSRTPEELRALQDDPLLVTVREKIANELATGREITAEARDIAARNPNYWSQVLMSGTNSMALTAPGLAFRNPLIGVSTMYGPTATGAYGELRERGYEQPGGSLADVIGAKNLVLPGQGVPRGMADKASTVEGLIEVGTELPALRALTREASPFYNRLGETVAVEFPGETIAGLSQSVNRAIAESDPDAPLLDPVAEGLRSGLEELPVTYGTVLAQSGAQAGMAHGIDALRRRNAPPPEQVRADATRDYALDSAQRLLDMIRNPPLTLRPPTEGEDLSAIRSSWEETERQLGLGMQARDEREFNTLPPMYADPDVQPDLFGTMPPPTTMGSRDLEAGGGVQAAPSPAPPQGTAKRSNLEAGRLSGALRAMAEMAPPEREFFLESLARSGAIPQEEIAPLLAQAVEADKTQPPRETPLASAFQQPTAAPPAKPATKEPAPTPAPQAPTVSKQEEKGGAASEQLDALAQELENEAAAAVGNPDVVAELSARAARVRKSAAATRSLEAREAAEPPSTRNDPHKQARLMETFARLAEQEGDAAEAKLYRDEAAKIRKKAMRADSTPAQKPPQAAQAPAPKPPPTTPPKQGGLFDQPAPAAGTLPPPPATKQPPPDWVAAQVDTDRTAAEKALAEHAGPLTQDIEKAIDAVRGAKDFNKYATAVADLRRLLDNAGKVAPQKSPAQVATPFAKEKAIVADFIKSPKKLDPVIPKSGKEDDRRALKHAQSLQPKLEELESLLATVPAEKLSPEFLTGLRNDFARIESATQTPHRYEGFLGADVGIDRLLYEARELAAGRVPEPTDRQKQVAEEKAKAERKAAKEQKKKPTAQVVPAPKAEAKPAAPPTGKPFPLPEVPPIRTKGAKRSRKVEAELEKQRTRFQELWAEYKQLGKQFKSDDLPTAIARANTPIGLQLHYLKNADTFRGYANVLGHLNHSLERAIEVMQGYKAPAPPTKRTADQEARAQTLDDLIADQTTLRLRDGMNEARDTVKNPQTVYRSFWKNTFPKLNWRAKEYVQELADETTYGSGTPHEGESMSDFIERTVKHMPKDTHPDAASLWKYVSFMQFADQYVQGERELPAVRKHKRGKKKPENKYESLVPRGTPIREQAGVEPMEGEIVPLPTTEEKFGEVIDDYAGLFEDPDVMVHATDHPDYTAFISEKAAKRRVLTWEKQAEAQAMKHRQANNDRVIFSLFDLTYQWSQPYIDAGYTVIPLDLQTGDDVLDLSVAYLHERFPDIADVYGILIAAPCTDFTLAGNRHMKAKDAEGKTELSKELVFQALRLVDYYKPKMWVIENPANSYIEDASGLPSARYEFQPYDFGDPYMKRTQLWGNFNTDLPVAPVYPREGSKMWSEYGGKSQATKNARSETPKGFAYAFFKANNAADATPHERLIAEFPNAAGAIEKALEAGFTEEQIREVVEPVYEADDAKEARADLRALVKKGTPEGEPQTLPTPEKRVQTKRAKFTNAAEKEVQAKLKAERDARLGKTAPKAEEAETEETTQEEDDEEVTELDDDVGTRAAGKSAKGIERGGVIEGTEDAAGTEASSRTQREGELVTPPSTPRENLMNFLGLDPFKFRQMGGKEQWDNARRAIMDKYGYADIVIAENQNWRNAVDHLLDGFESLQNMAQAMGQGNRIVSLGGKVSLYMRAKTKGTTKAYFAFRAGKHAPADSTIALHDQADFYSHEFAHALDYDLMERVGGMDDGGLSRMIRNRENAVGLPGTTLEAFMDLMTAIYFDAPAIAIEIQKAEHKIAKTKSAKQRAALQKRLDNLKSGAWRGRLAKTEFYKRAKDGPLKDYMTKPTELVARTFEAYISWKIQSQHAVGLVKFLGATDAIYRDDADEWIKRAYPHGQDRMNIFSRWDALLGQIAREDLYNIKAHPPGYANSEMNLGLLDPVAQARAMGITITPAIVQAHNLSVAAAKEFIEGESKRQDTFKRNLNQLMNDLKTGSPNAANTARAALRQLADTPDQIFKWLERRYPRVPILKTIRNNLSDAHISGRNKPLGVYREIQREENSFVNWVEEQLADVKIGRNMPAEWSNHFWDVIHNIAEPRNAEVRKQADRWRYVQEYLWKRRDRAGENIGYVDEPYARRVFLTLVADNPQFHADIVALRQAEKEELLAKLADQLQAATTDEEKEAIERRIKKAEEIDVEARTTEQIAAMKGLKWGAPVYLGAINEDSAKERVFGPLADKMLKDWYMKDPFWLLAGYAGAAARGEVMSRRFDNKQDKVFESWLQAAARTGGGIPTAFSGILREAMEVSMGFRKNPNSPLATVANAYATVSTAAALGRSALPSISEPLNILSKSFHSMRDLGRLFKAMVPYMQSTQQKERYAIADRFGQLSGTLVDAASSMTALAQNLGEDVQGNGLLARFSMRAYWFNLVASITAWQERVVNRVGFEIFYEAARMVRAGGEDAGIYRQWLREHGIRDADAFADYLKDARQVGMITFEDLVVPRNRELANALDHLVHTTIQKPTPSTKHIQSHNGAIGVALRLTSWITTNATNWRDALIDRTKSAITGQYGSETLSTKQRWSAMMAPVAMSLATMYIAQAAFVVARMLLTHPDEWEDRGEDFWDRFFSWKTQTQIVQYWGVLGWGMNTLTDIIAGARFDRGVYATVAGQAYGGLAQDIERILNVSLETWDELVHGKPEGPNTAEYNALQAVAHQGAMLSLLGLLSVLPTQPLYARVLGGVWTFWGTSPQAQREFAEIFVGEKESALKKKAAGGDIGAAMEVQKREEERKRDPARREQEFKKRLENRP